MEEIEGQCEECGTDYKMMANLEETVICPACKNETMNWDTTNGSQFAPSIIEIKVN